jgi:hypothetical protein
MGPLSDYFRAQAEWRERKAEEYPEDERNAQSAAALRSLAEFVEPREDGRYDLSVLHDLAAHVFEGSLGGEETQRVVSRYGFGYGVSAAQHVEFLDELLLLCLQDAYEFVGDGGDGEDPTGSLFEFEIEAAKDGVYLPHAYWRRDRASEQELAAVVESWRTVGRADGRAASRHGATSDLNQARRV